MTRIFISYSRRDEAFARSLATSLAQTGADIWMDIEDIPAGLKWSSAIQQGLDAAEVMLVIITPESMASRNVEDEWQYYLDNNKPVIPVLLRPAKVHFQLSRIQYVDFANQPYNQAFDRLKYEFARRGFPLGDTPTGTPPFIAPPQSVGHPVGQPPYVPPAADPIRTEVTTRVAGTLPRGVLISGALGIVALIVIGVLLLIQPDPSPAGEATATNNQVANQSTATLTAPPATNTELPPTNTDVPPTDTPEPTFFTGPVARNADWQPVEGIIEGVPMVLVPAGEFVMGTGQAGVNASYELCMRQLGAADSCRNQLLQDESGVKLVRFAQPFWLDSYEVHDEEFLPINKITWSEAQQLCQARGGRLPTEAEWEYAARGPDGLSFPWGNAYDNTRLNVCDNTCYDTFAYGWADQSWSDGFAERSQVGGFPSGKSWVGAYDLAGNLWEWTRTIYTADINDGFERDSDLSAPRVLKGSSWNWIGVEARGSARAQIADSVRAAGKSDWYGFRCVRDFRPEDVALLTGQ